MKERIVWTDEERENVAGEFALCRLGDPFATSQQLLKQAQLALPADRRRKTAQFSLIDKGLRQLMLEKFQALFEDAKLEPIILETPAPDPPPVDEDAVLNEVPLSKLWSVASQKFAEEIDKCGAVIREAAKALSPSVFPSPKSVGIASRSVSFLAQKPKLRVAIIGLLRRDRPAIERQMPTDVALEFIDKTKGPNPQQIPTKVDYVLVHRASHGWKWCADTKLGKERVLFVKDGVSALVQKIFQLRSTFLAQQSNIRVANGK